MKNLKYLGIFLVVLAIFALSSCEFYSRVEGGNRRDGYGNNNNNNNNNNNQNQSRKIDNHDAAKELAKKAADLLGYIDSQLLDNTSGGRTIYGNSYSGIPSGSVNVNYNKTRTTGWDNGDGNTHSIDNRSTSIALNFNVFLCENKNDLQIHSGSGNYQYNYHEKSRNYSTFFEEKKTYYSLNSCWVSFTCFGDKYEGTVTIEYWWNDVTFEKRAVVSVQNGSFFNVFFN